MEQITHQDFKKMLLSSFERVNSHKEEINKINVFPVPDQDTGNNLTKTLEGIKKAIAEKEFKNLKEISEATLDGALNGAQGNAGVIYTGFLAGFLPVLDENPIDAKKLALAFEKGSERARNSIQNPKSGTILDVVEAATKTFEKESEKEMDIVKILKSAILKSKEALLATREKMKIFKKANVVDAGGLGFLIILEGYLEALEGEKKEEKIEEKPSEQIRRFIQVLSHRFEVVALLENPRTEEKLIRDKLKKLGNCLGIVWAGNKIKLHIHTDYPEEVKNVIRQSGKILELRTEDMAKEVVGEESVRKVSIGIVTEDLTGLSQKVIERYQIEIVPTILDWPEMEKLPGENIYQKIRNAQTYNVKTYPRTSQATPKSYLEAFEKQLQKFEKVLCLTISHKVSGCYNSAIQAREISKKPERIFVLDSLNGAAGEALLVLRAIELIQEQMEIKETIEELKRTIPEINFCLIFEDPKWIESLGRITKSQANWVRRMKKINLRPLMEIKNGLVSKGGVVFARDMAEAVTKKIIGKTKKGEKIRVIINHADSLEQAEKLKKLLKEKLEVEVSFITLAPPLIGAATGPGTLIAAWTKI